MPCCAHTTDIKTNYFKSHYYLIEEFVFTLPFIYFFKDFIYLFLEMAREGEREREKHQCVVASHAPSTGDLACNPGMCPDRESNQRPFDLKAGTQSTEPHQPGLI